MVTPQLCAAFEVDDQGKPSAFPDPSLTHYRIRLFVKNAPPDALSVTYQLDTSYLSPVREVPMGVPDFAEHITSFGDYLVYVTIRCKTSNPQSFATRLSDALENYYREDASEDIKAAIDNIKSH
jgi:hypothetical protein